MKIQGITSCKNCNLTVRFTKELYAKDEWTICPICKEPESVYASGDIVPHTKVGEDKSNG